MSSPHVVTSKGDWQLVLGAGEAFSDMSSDEEDDGDLVADFTDEVEDERPSEAVMNLPAKLKRPKGKPKGTKAEFASAEEYAALIDEDAQKSLPDMGDKEQAHRSSRTVTKRLSKGRELGREASQHASQLQSHSSTQMLSRKSTGKAAPRRKKPSLKQPT